MATRRINPLRKILQLRKISPLSKMSPARMIRLPRMLLTLKSRKNALNKFNTMAELIYWKIRPKLFPMMEVVLSMASMLIIRIFLTAMSNGKIKWKCSKLIFRIKNHKQYCNNTWRVKRIRIHFTNSTETTSGSSRDHSTRLRGSNSILKCKLCTIQK